ncbi:hypothetical protein B0T26DRAFT_622030, partial [Lasiosphaeria miniovina]
AERDTFVSFSQFLTDTDKVSYAGFETTSVANEAAFKEIHGHILKMYSGIKNPQKIQSFALDDDYGDCIPILEQPSVHLQGIKELAPPPAAGNGNATGSPSINGGQLQGVPSILSLGLKDRFGNAVQCPAGTIPMQRLTAERLTRFKNLTDFFRKPNQDELDDRKISKRALPHSYARVTDTVTNFGGNSWMNLWQPNAYFSISQHWYVVNVPHQTVEGGWTVNRQKWDSKPRLFIFWTPDDYATGCWNLDCSGFVQTNNNWHLGGPWSPISTRDGTQYGFTLQWKLYRGNWWLFLAGSGSIEAVGYYPASIYKNGPITQKADFAKWGGEVAADSSGNFGEMGSGKFPSEGFGRAAYQQTIFTLPKDEDGGSGVWAGLQSL